MVGRSADRDAISRRGPVVGRISEAPPAEVLDVTVLSKDIMTVPEEEILEAEVLYTIVGGDVKYEGRR